MSREFRRAPFERYADDIVCHCSRMRDATDLLIAVKRRFSEVGLQINDQKTKVVYIDTFQRRNVATSFTFLGYDFEVRTLKNFKGEIYRKCMPGASRKAMRRMTRTIRSWKIQRSTCDSIKELARRYNAILRGWIQYYGKFWYRKFGYHLWTLVQSRLIKWVSNKYRISHRKAEHRLSLLQEQEPRLFSHWYLLRAPTNV